MGLYCRAELNYLKGATPTAVEVEIRNGRESLDGLSWTECGFELRRHVSAVTDWTDRRQLASTYVDEIDALARSLTGCDAVLFFPAIVRSPKAAQAHEDLAPIRFVHSDYTEGYRDIIGAPDHPYHEILRPSMERAGLTAAEVAGARRVLTLQFWRNVGPRVVDAPIAFCDARTVPRESLDPIPVPEYGGVRTEFESFAVRPPGSSDEHHWYTFPAMETGEVVVFRTYDSERAESGAPFWTPHSAFPDPVAGPAAAPRESVEIRAICLFAG